MSVSLPCGKHAHKNNIARHKRTCRSCIIVEGLQKHIDQLQKRLEVMEEAQRILQRPTNVVNNNTFNHVNNVSSNNTVNVSVFGQEPPLDQSTITPLLRDPASSVPAFVRLKHFVAGQGNVRIPNESDNRFIEVVAKDSSGNLRWIKRDKAETIEEITETSLTALADDFGGTRNPAWAGWYRRTGLDSDGYDLRPEWQTLQKKTELVLLNHSNAGCV